MSQSGKSLAAGAIGALLALAAGSDGAAKAPRAAAVQTLYDCKKLDGDAAQLACYAKASGDLEKAEESGQIVITDSQIVQATRKADFGLNAPLVKLPKEMHTAEKPIASMRFDIDHTTRTGDGRMVFFTTSGAVWSETENRDLPSDPVRGSQLSVNRGSFGSYFCTPEKMFAVQCRRLP